MRDRVLQKIFDDSEKAEFLESVGDELKDARRVIICFETPTQPSGGPSTFQYYQLGFKMTYEVLGFLDWMKEIVANQDEEG